MMTSTNPINRCHFGPDFPSLLELRGIRFMADGGDGSGAGGGDGTGDGSGDGKGGGTDDGGDKTFNQAEVDRIVKDRLAQQARNQFGDYADLKKQAAGAQTVEQQLATLTQKHADAEARALRSDIAAKHGVSAEDRDLFLTGSDEATLTAQAERLAAREGDRKKHGNRAPREGNNPAPKVDEERAFVRGLFGEG